MIKILLPLVLLFLFSACNNNKTTIPPKEETPKALQEKTASSEIYKRAPDDLVASLYAELLTKEPDLQKLQKQMDALQEGKGDSLAPFNTFNDKNMAYFSSANEHIELIKDSLVKEKMKTLIREKVAKYTSLTAKHEQLLKLIQANQLTIQDLLIILKIVKTFPLIEKYQVNNLPDSKSLEGFSKQQNETIKLADTLAK
jgi:hypothetical protein